MAKTVTRKAVAKKTRRRRPAGSAKPLYAQVEETIRQRLIDNYWMPGEALPSEFQLADELARRELRCHLSTEAQIALLQAH